MPTEVTTTVEVLTSTIDDDNVSCPSSIQKADVVKAMELIENTQPHMDGGAQFDDAMHG